MTKLPFLSLALLASLAATPLLAQEGKAPKDGVNSFTDNGQRSEANLIVAEFKGGQFVNALGLACVTYGTAEWKAEYGSKVDELTKGRMFRLGRDNWAILDHSTSIDFGGTTVPAGMWYLAIARDQAGKWSLALLEPAKVKAAGIWPFAADKAPRAHEIPLKHEKLATESQPKLQVAWETDPKAPTKGTFTITWGNQKLSTPFEVKLAPKVEAKEGSATKK